MYHLRGQICRVKLYKKKLKIPELAKIDTPYIPHVPHTACAELRNILCCEESSNDEPDHAGTIQHNNTKQYPGNYSHLLRRLSDLSLAIQDWGSF